jgi:hypothetical protein
LLCNHAFVGRAVESTEEEGLFARLLYHAASLTKALKHRFKLCGRETTGQNVATLAMLRQHTVACGATQSECPTVVSMIEHTHGHEVKRGLAIAFLLLDFLFRHNSLFKLFIADRLRRFLEPLSRLK